MTTNVYRVEFTIHATAYIKAESEDEATATAKALTGQFIEAAEDDEYFCGKPYEHADLPQWSFSPAMTIGIPSFPPELVD